jgi:uncharacterized membrane protein YeaQ/YmgE (transglycosylase-associated protein family)
LQEIAAEVIAHLQANLGLSLAIAFMAGLAAAKIVAYERRAGLVLSFVVGLIGYCLGLFVVIYSGLNVHLEQLGELRILFDLAAAFIGAFVVAALIHFVKPM